MIIRIPLGKYRLTYFTNSRRLFLTKQEGKSTIGLWTWPKVKL